MARLNAEGQAADSERRLQVAQEQVAEFAHQREEEAATLMRQLGEALTGLHPDSDPATLKRFQVCAGGLPGSVQGFSLETGSVMSGLLANSCELTLVTEMREETLWSRPHFTAEPQLF